MGLRLRLKANVDLSGYSPEVQVILTGLKRYGMIIADNGGDWYLSGIPDERWDNDHLVGELAEITCNDFEVVDVSSLQLDPDSAETPHLFSDGFDSGSTVNWSTAVGAALAAESEPSSRSSAVSSQEAGSSSDSK